MQKEKAQKCRRGGGGVRGNKQLAVFQRRTIKRQYAVARAVKYYKAGRQMQGLARLPPFSNSGLSLLVAFHLVKAVPSRFFISNFVARCLPVEPPALSEREEHFCR